MSALGASLPRTLSLIHMVVRNILALHYALLGAPAPPSDFPVTLIVVS